MSRSAEIVQRTLRYVPDTTYAYPLVIKGGKGCYLEDVEGRRYLDFTSNVASCPVGYGHPEIAEVIRRYAALGAHKVAGQDFFTEEQALLAEKLLSISPKNLGRVFFVNSGAEANENAIKLAYRKKSIGAGIEPNGLLGVSCYGAFHGRTLGALTFTYSKPIHKKGYPELAAIRIPFCTRDEDEGADQIARVLEETGERVAFVILELVQGEGGYNIASKRFIQTVRKETERRGIPLIVDEVQTGLGRTGRWWAIEHYGIEAEFITVAKGLQVGAVLFEEAYDPKERGAISSTWGGGDRIDMAVGLKTIEIIERDRLLDNAANVGGYMLRRLVELSQSFGALVQNPRGLGLMLAMDLPNAELRDRLELEAFRDGLLLLGCGERTIRLIPPLIITEEEADQGLEILERQLRKLAPALKAA